MNNALLAEIDAVRRLAAVYGRLRGSPSGLVGPDNRTIATCEPALAVYLARLHNCFTLLANSAIELRRRLTDREAMTKEMMNGKTHKVQR